MTTPDSENERIELGAEDLQGLSVVGRQSVDETYEHYPNVAGKVTIRKADGTTAVQEPYDGKAMLEILSAGDTKRKPTRPRRRPNAKRESSR